MRKEIKCIIVDDEPIARRIIKNHLSYFPGIDIEAECSNGIEAMEIINKKDIDLIFLDIQMHGITGIDLIKGLINAPKIILTTAYRDYAITAFDLNVVDYLLKPISLERFVKAVNKFLNLNKDNNKNPQSQEYILFKADRKQYKILLSDIQYLESLGDYVKVHTNDKSIVTKERLTNLENKLPGEDFTRIHRGYIVANKYIEAIGSGFIEINGQTIPIGRNYKDNVENIFIGLKS